MLSPLSACACDHNIFNGPPPQSNVTKMYCDRIAKWIKFYWSTHKGLEGVVDLTGLRLPMATLDFIKPAPIHFGKSDQARKYGNWVHEMMGMGHGRMGMSTSKDGNGYMERWEWVQNGRMRIGTQMDGVESVSACI